MSVGSVPICVLQLPASALHFYDGFYFRDPCVWTQHEKRMSLQMPPTRCLGPEAPAQCNHVSAKGQGGSKVSFALNSLPTALLVDSCDIPPARVPTTTSGSKRQGMLLPNAGEVERFCDEGHLDKAMLSLLHLGQQGVVLSVVVYKKLLHACMKKRARYEAQQMYAHLVEHGLELDERLGELVVTTLVKCGNLADGLQLFRRLSHRTVFSWTAIISGYINAGLCREALSCYELMKGEDVWPDKYTFVSLLKACGKLQDLEKAKHIHAHVVRCGLESDAFVGNTLISMYAKCGSIIHARQVFDRLLHRDVVSWNAMLGAYVQEDQGELALQIFEQMQVGGVTPDSLTFVSALLACSTLADKDDSVLVDGQNVQIKLLQKGKEFHVEAGQRGFETDVSVGRTLFGMYVKCGSIKDAQHMFDRLPDRNVVSWNAMIRAYAQNHQGQEALYIYKQMQEAGCNPEPRTFVSTLQACGLLAEKEEGVPIDSQQVKLAALQKGKDMHAGAARRGFESDIFVCNTLVSMYAKCGSMKDAQHLFARLSERDVVTWNAMISALAQHDLAAQALQTYEQMRMGFGNQNARTFVSALQACGNLAEKEEGLLFNGQNVKLESLLKGKEIHMEAAGKGFNSDAFVTSALVSMYAKCGSISDAEQVFNNLLQRDVPLWTAMLVAYIHQNDGERALQMYREMQVEGVWPEARTFACALQACVVLAAKEEPVLLDGQYIHSESLRRGNEIHDQAAKRGFGSDTCVACGLISMYSRCGSLRDAVQVFDQASDRDITLWNAVLSAYIQHDEEEVALQLYRQMQEEGVRPDSRTTVCALEACGILADKEESLLLAGRHVKVESLRMGKELHHDAAAGGFELDMFVGSTLVSFYGKCGSLADAQHVFSKLSKGDVVAWTAMVAAYAQQDEGERALDVFWEMQVAGVRPNAWSFVSALQACGCMAGKEESRLVDGQNLKLESLQLGKKVHAEAVERGFQSDFLCQVSISMYAKCGSVTNAQIVFDRLPDHDVLSWDMLIAAYVQQEQAEMALELYERMQKEGISPDARAIVSALQACGMLAGKEESTLVAGQHVKAESLRKGKELLAEAVVGGLDSDVFVVSTLISTYAKCGSITDAEEVFMNFCAHNSESWTAMLAAYAQLGHGEEALHIYRHMQLESMKQDAWNFVSALQACGSLAEKERHELLDGQHVKLHWLQKGREIHAELVARGCDADVFVGNALVSMYSKCGSVEDALLVFNRLPDRFEVSWNTIITACAQQTRGDKALQLYAQMHEEGVKPQETTFLAVLEACGNRGDLHVCMHAHQSIVQGEFMSSLRVATSLIHAYGKCGSMVDAQYVFDCLPQSDVVSWTALIAGYARQGNFARSIQCYESMCLAGVKPDGVTFIALLAACSHAGLVDKGLEYFESMRVDHGVPAEVQHYVCVIDLVGRAGLFSKLQEFVSEMPIMPNILPLWLCLLGACRKHGNLVLGRHAFDCAVSLQPKQAAPYLIMSNIYAHAGLLDHAQQIDEMRQRAGACKEPGQSWIMHKREVHTFLVGDRSHAQDALVFGFLEDLNSGLRKTGYVAGPDCERA